MSETTARTRWPNTPFPLFWGFASREFSPGRAAEFSRLVTHNLLMKRSDVVLTPHIAFNSKEAIERLSALTLESILDYLDGKSLKHCCV